MFVHLKNNLKSCDLGFLGLKFVVETSNLLFGYRKAKKYNFCWTYSRKRTTFWQFFMGLIEICGANTILRINKWKFLGWYTCPRSVQQKKLEVSMMPVAKAVSAQTFPLKRKTRYNYCAHCTADLEPFGKSVAIWP
jgi:hypothetical protein